MITQDKPIETFCIIDKFDKNLNVEQSRKSMFIPITVIENISEIVRGRLSESELRTILEWLFQTDKRKINYTL
jgi:hypothetical protein